MATRASTSAASSPPPYAMSSEVASTAATSPPPHDESEDESKFQDALKSKSNPSEPISPQNEDEERRYTRLKYVLEKSAIYSQILKARMDQDAEMQRKAMAQKQKQKAAPKSSTGAKSSTTSRAGDRLGKKRTRVEDEDEEDSGGAKKQRANDGHPVQPGEDDEELPIFQQPALITGAKLKKYQLEGLQWMVSLDQNGISGILADEMGLGKTLQTIAFSAYLRERKHLKPFLIVCPLSVLHNWLDEYEKFAPQIPVCMYHGTPAERAELRRTVMLPPSQRVQKQSPSKKGPRKQKGKAKAKAGDNDDREAYEKAALDFPVVVTTYEMIIKDRVHLAHYDWGYIVVDEGHRLKNLDCRLMKEIKKYQSAGRMILTGTPLHNNLAELWSLLNFILPEIFDDLDAFQEWFNLPNMQNTIGSERSQQIISSLHAILKPFLLRRLKSDVETNLPPKKEYVLYAPLSIHQREAYNQVLSGTMRSYLLGESAKAPEPEPAKKDEEQSDDGPRRLRSQTTKRARKKYGDLDGDDDEYFEKLEKGELDEQRRKDEERDLAELAREHQRKATAKQINNMKLQNTIMQLRKVCSHPFLFHWPLDPETQEPVLGEELVSASGKMMVLDRLLRELFKRKHKVLLFSQFTTMLDIIEEWATTHMGWNICRIDGSTQPLERRQEMNRFQTGGDNPNAPKLFLLSTRAGGLGINLVAADTVIFYDQDWNPQMDAQAQDRAHRIGQTKPVLIFRLVSAHTIETKIMQRATEKRQLEALVIAKGKFKKPAAAAGRSKPETMADMAAELLRLEGEKIEVVPNTAEGKASVLSDEDLHMLLDRSPEVFTDRGKGWTSADKHVPPGEAPASKPAKKTAFAVYDAPQHEGNDALAKMLGEDSDVDG